MEKFSVTFDGFKTKEQAKEFLSWYSNQGEQNFDIWRECRISDAEHDMNGCPCWVGTQNETSTGFYTELK